MRSSGLGVPVGLAGAVSPSERTSSASNLFGVCEEASIVVDGVVMSAVWLSAFLGFFFGRVTGTDERATVTKKLLED